jgi:hypothetical protein
MSNSYHLTLATLRQVEKYLHAGSTNNRQNEQRLKALEAASKR